MRQLALILSCLFVAVAASADAGAERAVTIDVAAREASGVARGESLDPIGCRVVSALGIRSAVCFATSAKASISCVTREATLIEVAQAAGGGGALRFAWDESETCTVIDRTEPASPKT